MPEAGRMGSPRLPSTTWYVDLLDALDPPATVPGEQLMTCQIRKIHFEQPELVVVALNPGWVDTWVLNVISRSIIGKD
jgi:hypothetical protein